MNGQLQSMLNRLDRLEAQVSELSIAYGGLLKRICELENEGPSDPYDNVWPRDKGDDDAL